MTLTPRQREILSFLEEHFDRNGFMPSTREIQARFGFASQTAAVNHLRNLQRKGAIEKLAGKARGLAFPGRPKIVQIPVLGQIAAGMPAQAELEMESHLSIDAGALGIRSRKGLFALRVRGDSMVGAHILDGDMVVLEAREARPGEIVAALIDGEPTLKRFLVRRGQPYLQAENPHYPELVPASELVLQGVVVAVIRRFAEPS